MKYSPAKMHPKKIPILFIISSIIFINPAFGDEKEHLELAFTLVEQTNMSSMFVELAETFMQPYFENHENPDTPGLLKSNQLRALFEDEVRLGEDELKWMLAGIYAKHFTENELREIVRFFDSPPGAAWLDKRLFIQTESEQLGLEWGKLLTQRVFQKIKKSD
jgi:hypothetical protein